MPPIGPQPRGVWLGIRVDTVPRRLCQHSPTPDDLYLTVQCVREFVEYVRFVEIACQFFADFFPPL